MKMLSIIKTLLTILFTVPVYANFEVDVEESFQRDILNRIDIIASGSDAQFTEYLDDVKHRALSTTTITTLVELNDEISSVFGESSGGSVCAS